MGVNHSYTFLSPEFTNTRIETANSRLMSLWEAHSRGASIKTRIETWLGTMCITWNTNSRGASIKTRIETGKQFAGYVF